MNALFTKIAAGKGLKFLLLKALIFLIIVWIVDYTIGQGLRFLYLRQKTGWEASTKVAVEESAADIIILGSSRGQHGYHTEVIEDRLKLSCYNAGREGQTMLYHYPVFKAIFKRHQPKIVILDCEDRMFASEINKYDRLSCLLPFYYSYPEMKAVLDMRGNFEKIKMLSKIYPYNSMLFKIVSGNLKSMDEDEIKGYKKLNNSLNEPPRFSYFTSSYESDTLLIKLFKDLIEDCKNANIRLYITSSPYHSYFKGKDLSFELCKEIAAKNGVPYLDYTQDSFFMKRSQLFDDTIHVNNDGAKIFSNMLCDKILEKK